MKVVKKELVITKVCVLYVLDNCVECLCKIQHHHPTVSFIWFSDAQTADNQCGINMGSCNTWYETTLDERKWNVGT